MTFLLLGGFEFCADGWIEDGYGGRQEIVFTREREVGSASYQYGSVSPEITLFGLLPNTRARAARS